MKSDANTQNKEPSYIVGATHVVVDGILYKKDYIDGQPIESFKRSVEEAQIKLAIHQRLTELGAFRNFTKEDFKQI